MRLAQEPPCVTVVHADRGIVQRAGIRLVEVWDHETEQPIVECDVVQPRGVMAQQLFQQPFRSTSYDQHVPRRRVLAGGQVSLYRERGVVGPGGGDRTVGVETELVGESAHGDVLVTRIHRADQLEPRGEAPPAPADSSMLQPVGGANGNQCYAASCPHQRRRLGSSRQVLLPSHVRCDCCQQDTASDHEVESIQVLYQDKRKQRASNEAAG